MEQVEKGMLRGWRALLAMALTASLALGMTPLAATEAHAATKTKSYVYDVVYGTYQGKYAIGFKQGKGSNDHVTYFDSVDVISATKGVTIKVRANDFAGDEGVEGWATELQSWGRRGFNPAVIGVPFKKKGKTSYRAYSLDGKQISNAIYDCVGAYVDGNPKNSFTILWSGEGKRQLVADCYNSTGKKVQTITLSSPSVIDFAHVYSEEIYGTAYLRFSVNSSSFYYKLKGGKFVKSSSPWRSSSLDEGYVGDGVYLRSDVSYDDDFDRVCTYYLEDSKGRKTTLPHITEKGADYDVAEGLGVYANVYDDGMVYVYDKFGKRLGTLRGNGTISKTDIPGVWAMGSLAFNSSLKIVGQEKNAGYEWTEAEGKLKGKPIFSVPIHDRPCWEDFGHRIYVNENMTRVRVGEYLLESTLTASTPVHTFKNGRQVAVAKNFSGKFGVVDTKGNVLIPFSYSDFYDTGSGDYIMMKKGKGWQFVKVSHLASGKAVKGGIYTVGKLKYKVTSTAKKSRTVTVVGHAKGKAATGSASVPATVKIAGQKFKVTAVGASAFKNTKLTSVTIGKYVTTIGKNAFAGSKKLTKVTVKSKALKSVGKGAFKGINKKAKFKVPASKVKAYKKILNSKAGVKKSMKVSK